MSQAQNPQNNLDLRQIIVDYFKQTVNIDLSNVKMEDVDEYVKTLNPNEKVIFRLNSDETDYIVAVDQFASVVYFFKGEYGGYVSKSSPASPSQLFLVTVERETLTEKFLVDISHELSEKYPDIQKIYINHIKYKLIEIEAEVIDKEKYVLIKKIKPKGKEHIAEAFEINLLLGSRRSGVDEDKAELLKAKYAAMLKLPLYSVKVSGSKAKWDAFYLRLKFVTRAPELITPASQIVSDNTDTLEIDLFGEAEQPQKQEQPQNQQPQEKAQPSQQNQPSQGPQEKQEQKELDVTLAVTEKTQPQGGYVELYLLDFNLPSKYIAKISTRAEKVDDKTYKIETLVNTYLAKKVENLRRSIYEQVGRHFVNTSIGWIAVSEEGVKRAREINEYIKKELKEIAEKKKITIKKQTYEIPEELTKRIQEITSKYYVKAIRILLNYEDAKYLIENVINQLKEGIEELQEKIEQAEKENKRALARVYEYNLKYQQLLLQSFEEFYAKKFKNTSSNPSSH